MKQTPKDFSACVHIMDAHQGHDKSRRRIAGHTWLYDRRSDGYMEITVDPLDAGTVIRHALRFFQNGDIEIQAATTSDRLNLAKKRFNMLLPDNLYIMGTWEMAVYASFSGAKASSWFAQRTMLSLPWGHVVRFLTDGRVKLRKVGDV